jgi:hypothetical protein
VEGICEKDASKNDARINIRAHLVHNVDVCFLLDKIDGCFSVPVSAGMNQRGLAVL